MSEKYKENRKRLPNFRVWFKCFFFFFNPEDILSWPCSHWNSVLSLHMRVLLCTSAIWEPQCLAGFPGISEFFCQLTVSFLWRKKRVVKVLWRYKCSFYWLNNNSLSQWSDKNLSSSSPIPHTYGGFRLGVWTWLNKYNGPMNLC